MIGVTTNASTYRLSVESSSFLEKNIDLIPEEERGTYPKSIDNGRWSRWLRGLRGVERKIVLALDALCPGTAKIYDIGPEAGPWVDNCCGGDPNKEFFRDNDLNQSTNIPLWDSMKGDQGKILHAWKDNVPRRMWISWTPSKLRQTDAWIELEQYEYPYEDYFTDEEANETYETHKAMYGYSPKRKK